MRLPCGHSLPDAEILRLAGKIRYARRNTKPGPGVGGRPKSLDRCPCGKYTAARAKARGHKCEEE